ncbi:MAG: winged helix-turn-helix transcriptional regulator [Spirochaetia bacterium]|nr:winged helix-turn-helix transcriptional regulator [Spirochaetia bacterium]
MKFIYNHAIEFYCFLSTYIEAKIEKEKEKENLSLPADPELAAVYDKVDQEISPFLKHDIELLFNKMFVTLWLLYCYIHEHNFTDEIQLISFLQNQTEDDFRGYYLKRLWLTETPLDEIKEKDIKNAIMENYFHTSSTQAKLIKQLLMNPEDWKPKILHTVTDFYEKHYLPIKESLIETGTRRAAAAEILFNKDQNHYLDTLTLGHYRDLLHHNKDTTVYISYTGDRNLMISIKSSVILLGLTRETLLTSANRKLQTNMLFNTLSDTKRLEILRLLREREWFSNELAIHFGLTAATMSYHLNKMNSAGLITFRFGDQKKLYYSLSRENLENYLNCARADLLGDTTCNTKNDD